MKIDELLDALGKIDPVYIEEAEKTRFARRSRVRYWVPAAACAALLVLGGSFGLWRFNNGASESAGEAAGAADDASAASGTLPEDAEDVKPDGAENVWRINEVAELQQAVACGVAPASVEYYTAEQLEAYYGIRILPETLPGGYALEDAAAKKYAVEYDGDGSVLDDNCTLEFESTESGGEFRIAARTVDMGEMTSFADTKLPASEISGTKVTVGHYRVGSSGSGENDGYLAIYEKDGVTVTVEGIAMTEADFKLVIEGLLE